MTFADGPSSKVEYPGSLDYFSSTAFDQSSGGGDACQITFSYGHGLYGYGTHVKPATSS